MRILNLFLLNSLLAIILFPGCKDRKKEIKLPEVTVVEVIEEDIHETWTLVGQTVSDPKVELLARVSGFLEKRYFKQGAFVKKDELLFQIEKDQYIAKVNQAKANLAVKEAVLKNKIIIYKRNKFLREKESVSQADLDKAIADRDSAIGDRDMAKAKLQDAELNLGYTDIKAPFEGRIGLAKYNVGNMVGPESGVLATIVSLDPMRVEFNVNEAVFLRAQQKSVERKVSLKNLLEDLEVKLILSNATIYGETGKIYFWNNTVSSETGTILMRAEFKNSEFILSPGQYVKVQIQSKIPRKGLVIPQAAIQTALGGKFVMVVTKENIIKTKDIKLGYSFETKIVVKEGLVAGDRVVTQGIQLVRPGDKVSPVTGEVNNAESSDKVKNKPAPKDDNNQQPDSVKENNSKDKK